MLNTWRVGLKRNRSRAAAFAFGDRLQWVIGTNIDTGAMVSGFAIYQITTANQGG
jgi:hypothetical protein